MQDFSQRPSSAFEGTRLIAQGSLADVAMRVKAAMKRNPTGTFLTFDDATGSVIDLDLRGGRQDIVARLLEWDVTQHERSAEGKHTAPARGRPRLGVVAREVTLLPRHWEWLAAQPGGASQALRRLVDQARNAPGGNARAAQAVAYRFMSAMAGDFPDFEEASRALFAGDLDRLAGLIVGWPGDVRDYALKLARG